MDKDRAEKFAEEWITAWNNHDLQRILSHYEEDFEMSSPTIIKITGESSGTLQGQKRDWGVLVHCFAKVSGIAFQAPAYSARCKQCDINL